MFLLPLLLIMFLIIILIIFMPYTDTTQESASHVTGSRAPLKQSPPKVLGWHGGGACRRQLDSQLRKFPCAAADQCGNATVLTYPNSEICQ